MPSLADAEKMREPSPTRLRTPLQILSLFSPDAVCGLPGLTLRCGSGHPRIFEFRFRATTRHMIHGDRSPRVVRSAFGAHDADGERDARREAGRRGLHGSTILRHHRECVPRIFALLDLGRTGSHHHRRVRCIENDLFPEVLRRADPDDASVYVDYGRALGGRGQIWSAAKSRPKSTLPTKTKIFERPA